jgi:hypothetical protein
VRTRKGGAEGAGGFAVAMGPPDAEVSLRIV